MLTSFFAHLYLKLKRDGKLCIYLFITLEYKNISYGFVWNKIVLTDFQDLKEF